MFATAATAAALAPLIIGLAMTVWRAALRRLVDLEGDVRRLRQELQERSAELREATGHELERAATGASSRPVAVEELMTQAEAERLDYLATAADLQRRGQHTQALDYLFAAFQPAMPAAARAELHALIANAFQSVSRLPEAEGHYRQALAAAETAQDDHARANALFGLGLVSDERGALDKAERHYNTALDIHQRSGNRLGQANAIGMLGTIYGKTGDLDRAEQNCRKALHMFEGLGDRVGQANQLGNLGILYHLRGSLEQAEHYHQQALQISGQTGNRLAESHALGNLANVYADRGQLDKAEQHHRKAVEISRETGNRLSEARDLGNLGLLQARKTNASEALRYLREARAIFAEVGAPSDVEKADHAIRALERLGGTTPPKEP